MLLYLERWSLAHIFKVTHAFPKRPNFLKHAYLYVKWNCGHKWLWTNEIPMTVWYNANYIAGTGGLTSSVSTLFPEEAVNEVKRQAMSELQKAVSEAERKAHEMISSERAKMERTVAEAKRQAAEDALSIINQQEDSSEVGIYAHVKTSEGVTLMILMAIIVKAVAEYSQLWTCSCKQR